MPILNIPLFKGIDVSTGTYANIAIRRTHVEKLPDPFTECNQNIENFNSNLTRYLLSTGYKYRQRDCFDL